VGCGDEEVREATREIFETLGPMLGETIIGIRQTPTSVVSLYVRTNSEYDVRCQPSLDLDYAVPFLWEIEKRKLLFPLQHKAAYQSHHDWNAESD
jgi:hypothetical protein